MKHNAGTIEALYQNDVRKAGRDYQHALEVAERRRDDRLQELRDAHPHDPETGAAGKET